MNLVHSVSLDTILKAAVWSVLLCLVSAGNTGPPSKASFRLFGNEFHNHSYVDFNSVGDIDPEALTCRTDLTTCCRDNHTGDWYFPNGERLNKSELSDIYMARLYRNVQVRRRNNATTAGMYRCEIETSVANGDSREILYAGLYSNGGQYCKGMYCKGMY